MFSLNVQMHENTSYLTSTHFSVDNGYSKEGMHQHKTYVDVAVVKTCY